MKEFFDHQMFGVRRLGVTDGGKAVVGEVSLPGGKCVARIKIQVLEAKFQIMRALNLTVSYPLQAEILGANDRVIMSIEKLFSWSDYLVSMQDSTRRGVGTLTRFVTETGVDKGTYDYRLTDPSDEKKSLVAVIRGNWRKANLLQIIDERGGVMGKITRTDPAMGLGSVSDPKFHVVNCYAPPQQSTRRLAVLGTAALIDNLVD